jgi:hypothetical protein
LSAFWNDANPATYPAVLIATSPSAATLPAWRSPRLPAACPWTSPSAPGTVRRGSQQAKITGNSRVDRWTPFAAPVSTTQVQVTVTQDQPAYAGEFTRVAELAP